ncbi:hypothetical protein [Pseudomonas matsuisoli]|uniref:Uncharacterized protein n=1 Tax=Pseudomonas matsuisoli TaxID=1515666 RepID=A0A917Q0T3_9PSED|nr:hypothetical protein [Pseudomonas matsuisoli]GGK05652.1 hypothetical protein GCM10009304_34690 [Pseudomonas matsuisoli]
MHQEVISVDSYEDLLRRPAFEGSLAFHPKAPRQFGSVIAPYTFLERIPCGIESCHTPHLSGYLITTSDGLETAIGSLCGRKYFGVSFQKERKRVDAEVARQKRLESIKLFLNGLPALLNSLEAFERDYRHLQEQRERLHGAVGREVYQDIRERAKRDNAIMQEYVRMSVSEAEAFFETNNRTRSDSKEWPTKAVILGTLRGLDFFKADVKALILTTLVIPVRELSMSRLSDIESMSSRQVAALAKWIGEVPQKLIEARAVIEAGRRFFTSENILSLVHLGADRRCILPMVESLRDTERREMIRIPD